jgi:hypothetical protein
MQSVKVAVREKDGPTPGGKLSSFRWDEEQGMFVGTVVTKVGKLGVTSLLEIEPDLESVTLMAIRVNGWLSIAEGRSLFKYSKKSTGPVVEIGSFMGRSGIFLGWGSRLGTKQPVYAIDPHTGSPEIATLLAGTCGTYGQFWSTINRAGLVETIIPMVMTSEQASTQMEEEVSFVFIDGAHEGDYPDQDFALWDRHLAVGGHMAYHDSTGGWPDVKKTVQRVFHDSDRYQVVEVAGTITIAEKKEHGERLLGFTA